MKPGDARWKLSMPNALAGRRLRSGVRHASRLAVELEALYDLSSRLRAAYTPEEMFPVLVEHATRLLRADHGALTLLDADHVTLTRVHVIGDPLEASRAIFPVSGSISGRVVETGTPYLTGDIRRSAGPHPHPPALKMPGAGVGPVAVVALQSEQDVIGTLAVGRTCNGKSHPFTDADVRLLQGIAEMGGTAIRRASLHQHLEQVYLQTVLALARAMDARDVYAAGRGEHLAAWAEAIARALGCGEDEVQDIRWGALLHDIGKIGSPDGILRKAGPLTADEWVTMREHPVVGERILLTVPRMNGVARLVRHHQEKWDGTGYPDGLRGEAIPLGARILAAVKAYGVITGARPYKAARSHAEALAELRRCAGTQFDPVVVETFSRVLEGEREKAG